MSKEKATTEKPVDTDKLKDDNAVNDTIAPAAKTVPAEDGEDEIAVEDAPKTVNIPLSQSNALEPASGVQVNVPGELTEQVAQTNPYNPTDTKLQNVLKDDAQVSEHVTKAKYDALLSAFNEVVANHVLDVTHQQLYRVKAGIII